MNKNYLRKLASEGFSIIPVAEDKKPIGKWKEYQNKCRTPDEVENLTSPLFGLVTGVGGLEVIDIDLKVIIGVNEQKKWFEEFINFLNENIYDFYEKFVIAKTKNNGYHILYKAEELRGNTKIAKLKGSNNAIIESRGNGGMVVIYDNFLTAKKYHDIQIIDLKDRDTLWSCCKFFDYVEETNIPNEEKKHVQQKENELTPWQDFNNKTTVWELIENDFDIVKKISDKTIIKRHGAESPHSGYIYKNSGCMYLFSTGTCYPAEKLLSPFSVYTYKNCNGDFTKASSELYHKGFGSRKIKELKTEILEIPKINADFPIDIFPDEFQKYIIECNRTLDSSIDYMGAGLLWLFAVIIGNSVKIEVKKGWLECCNIWIAIVGKAGLGKTPSINNIIFPLIKANNKEIKNFIKQSQKYEKWVELSKEEKALAEEVKKPFKSQFIVNDITLEALVDLHEENKNSVGVFKDELAGFFKDMNKYRIGSDLEFWLSSWSNKGVSLNRKTAKSSFVESPIIPVLGGIQPSILTQFFTEENKDNGFIDRMLLVFPDLEVESYNDAEMDNDLIEWYSDTIITYYNYVKKDLIKYNEENEIEPVVVRFEPDAKIEWKRIYNKITFMQNDETETEYFKSMLPKQKSYIPRYALILAFIRAVKTGEIKIDKDILLKAEKLSDYFVVQSKKIKFDSIEKKEAKKIINTLKDKPKAEQAIEIIKTNPNISKKELAEMLEVSRQQIYNYLKDAKL
jgi:hypothetical protein